MKRKTERQMVRDMIDIPTKQCPHCKQTLPTAAFTYSSKRISSWCRTCHREYSRQQAHMRRIESNRHGRKPRPKRCNTSQVDTRCYLPSPAEIAAECVKIRQQWDVDQQQLRRFHEPGMLEQEIANRAQKARIAKKPAIMEGTRLST